MGPRSRSSPSAAPSAAQQQHQLLQQQQVRRQANLRRVAVFVYLSLLVAAGAWSSSGEHSLSCLVSRAWLKFRTNASSPHPHHVDHSNQPAESKRGFIEIPGSNPEPSSSSNPRQEGQREGEDEEEAEPARFLLYRLIGNDIPPLQCQGQLYANTLYALQHETRRLPQCRKLWVLNNIVNATEQALLLDLLLQYGYGLEDVVVRRVDYSRVANLSRSTWTEVVTAQNEARNFIVDHGKRQGNGVRWILPFDGNQFITREAWEAIRRAADRHEKNGLKYFKVPMFRVYKQQQPTWLNADTEFVSLKDKAPFLWESQVAFRVDSTDRYTEGMKYGKDNKLEFIDRVCGTAKFKQQPDNLRKKRDARHLLAIAHVQEGVTQAAAATSAEVAAEAAKASKIVDTGQCGCHREVGNDRKIRPFDPSVAAACGYSIRLWYYPCGGVRTSIIFTNPKYRGKLRDEGHKWLTAQIEAHVDSWVKSRQN